MTDTWERIHDAALTRHEDGGAELARLVIEADDLFQALAAERDALRAENERLRVVLGEIATLGRCNFHKVRAALQEKTDDR